MTLANVEGVGQGVPWTRVVVVLVVVAAQIEVGHSSMRRMLNFERLFISKIG